MTFTTSLPQAAITQNREVFKQDRLGRVRVSAQRRRALLEEFDASSMSAAEFARWAGLKYQTFATWARKHRKASLVAEPPLTSHDLARPALPAAGSTLSPPTPTQDLSWIEAEIARPSSPQLHSPNCTDAQPLVLQIPGGSRLCTDDVQAMAELLKALGVGRC